MPQAGFDPLTTSTERYIDALTIQATTAGCLNENFTLKQGGKTMWLFSFWITSGTFLFYQGWQG